MRIVAAGEADLVEARALVFEYLAATQGERGRPVPANPAELPELLRADLDDLLVGYSEPGALLIAYEGDKAYGCVGLRPRPEHGIADVSRLYVRPAYRNRGVARALMTELFERARVAGFTQIAVDVMTTRVRVSEFYRRLGFIETGTQTSYGTPMVLMRRLL